MPPIKKVNKEDIINAGYNIAKKYGMEGINARRIAKELNCSIQPIFHNFLNMEELKIVVLEKVKQTYKSYIKENIDKEKPYKQIGLGYIKFAKNEPILFKILFISEYNISPIELINSDSTYKDISEYASSATDIDKNNIDKFHLKMWIFTHGIATLIASNTCTFTNDEISEMLTEEFNALMKLKSEKGDK